MGFYHFYHFNVTCINQGPYSPTILDSVRSLALHFFLYSKAFACNTTSDWLKHTIWPIRSGVAFKFTNLEEKDKVCSYECLVITGPGAHFYEIAYIHAFRDCIHVYRSTHIRCLPNPNV